MRFRVKVDHSTAEKNEKKRDNAYQQVFLFAWLTHHLDKIQIKLLNRKHLPDVQYENTLKVCRIAMAILDLQFPRQELIEQAKTLKNDKPCMTTENFMQLKQQIKQLDESFSNSLYNGLSYYNLYLMGLYGKKLRAETPERVNFHLQTAFMLFKESYMVNLPHTQLKDEELAIHNEFLLELAYHAIDHFLGVLSFHHQSAVNFSIKCCRNTGESVQSALDQLRQTNKFMLEQNLTKQVVNMMRE